MQVWLKLHTNRWLSNRWWSRNLQSTSLKLKKRKKKCPIINDNSFSVQHLWCPRSLCFSLCRAHLKQSPFNCSLQRSGSEWTLTPGCLPSSIVSRLMSCTSVEPRLCTCISGSSVSPAIATKFVDISFESDSVKVVRMDPLELRAASSEFAYTGNWPSSCYVLEFGIKALTFSDHKINAESIKWIGYSAELSSLWVAKYGLGDTWAY